MNGVERRNHPPVPRAGEREFEAPSHLRLDPPFLALSAGAEAALAATLSPWSRRDELYLVADIYLAAHQRHPEGHAGWWSFSFDAGPTLRLLIRSNERGIEVVDPKGAALGHWLNEAADIPPHATLTLQMVLRQRYNDSIVHLQPIHLYRDPALSEAAARRRALVGAAGRGVAGLPPPSFQWPASSTVRIIAPSLPPLARSAQRGTALQLAGLLSREAIAWRFYADSFDPDLRGPIAPIGDLAEEVTERDLLLILYDDRLPDLAWLLRLPGCKAFLFLGLPDPARLQVFDAEAHAHQQQARRDVALAGACELWAAPSDGLTVGFARLLLTPPEPSDAAGQWPADALPPDDGRRPDAAALAALRHAAAAGSLPPGRLDAIRRRQVESHVLRCALPERRALWDIVEEAAADLVPDGHPLLLAPGRFLPGDGIIPLLTLFAALLGEAPDAVLVIFGDRPPQAFLHYLEHMLGSRFAAMAGRTHLLADPDDATLKRLYRRCTALIHLGSAWDRALEDAVAFGKPLIVSGRHAPEDAAARAGYRLHDSDIAEQAAAIARLLRRPAAIAALLADQRRALARRRPPGADGLWQLLETAVMRLADL